MRMINCKTNNKSVNVVRHRGKVLWQRKKQWIIPNEFYKRSYKATDTHVGFRVWSLSFENERLYYFSPETKTVTFKEVDDNVTGDDFEALFKEEGTLYANARLSYPKNDWDSGYNVEFFLYVGNDTYKYYVFSSEDVDSVKYQ